MFISLFISWKYNIFALDIDIINIIFPSFGIKVLYDQRNILVKYYVILKFICYGKEMGMPGMWICMGR